jgi:hypothetical protein
VSVFIDSVARVSLDSCETTFDVRGHLILSSSACGQTYNINGTVDCNVGGQFPTGFKVNLLTSSFLIEQQQILTASGAFSFNYNDPGIHYIQIVSPSGTVLLNQGPFASLASQTIGPFTINCSTP